MTRLCDLMSYCSKCHSGHTVGDINCDGLRKWPFPLTPTRVDKNFNTSGSKYLRQIQLVDGRVDVYAVLAAFEVTRPALQHAIKKLLCAGLRGKGDVLQDLKEARDAIDRAIQMESTK